MKFFKRTWAEISLKNAEYNFLKVRSTLPNGVKLCPVVKADAYGHDVKIIAPFFERLGADYFAVSNIDEAISLRKINITKPILILGYTPPKLVNLLYKHDITQCVYSRNYANLLSLECSKAKVKIKIHIKIDSGMGRIGFVCLNKNIENLKPIIDIYKNQNFYCEGIFTHFSQSDLGESGKKYTLFQFENFKFAVNYLRSKGVVFKIKHCSNSGAILSNQKFYFDMVRAGIILYGINPVNEVKFKPVMSLKSLIIHLKEVKKGQKISYGKDFTAKRNMKIATLPVGYADGFWRSNYKKGYFVLVNNSPCKIVGKICMDQLMIDVSNVKCKLGDEVLLFGDNKTCNSSKIAKINNSIPYEILCSIGKRVPRIKKGVRYEKKNTFKIS